MPTQLFIKINFIALSNLFYWHDVGNSSNIYHVVHSALVDLSNLLSSHLISFFSTMTDLAGGPQGGRRLKERGTEGVGLRDDSVQKSDSFERIGSFGQFVSSGSKLVQSKHARVFTDDASSFYVILWIFIYVGVTKL